VKTNKSESNWLRDVTPIVFVRPIGIAAGDAMRLLELAKRVSMPVRWRLAPVGVAADVYLAHRFCVVQASEAITLPVATRESGWAASGHESDDPAVSVLSSARISLDAQGYYRARPVCVLGRDVDTSGLEPTELAPLRFPDALRELEQELSQTLCELLGTRMLFTIGALAWEQRSRWPTHSLHAVEAGQLIAVVDPQTWTLFLLEGCSVERMGQANLVPRPRSAGFSAQGFHAVKLEAALWEYAKRCPEESLKEMLPTVYLHERLTHRRTPHLKEHALGDHCVAILRALDVGSRTAQELQDALRITQPALLRALTCLAVVRAIQPESSARHGLARFLARLWRKWSGQSAPYPQRARVSTL
jgi:hypothetical protein